jgi:ribonuclease P protein component
LGSRPLSRTSHFVLHALPRKAQGDGAADAKVADSPPKLSTTSAEAAVGVVDDLISVTLERPVAGTQAWRLGLVLPKKQARRSVTRSLIRHQAREALRRHAPAVLALGRYGADIDGWVVRLRAPFDRKLFPSAASAALQALVRQELDELWSRLSNPASAGVRSPSNSPAQPAADPRGAA